MEFIKKFLNIFKKKQNQLGYTNQGGNLSSSSHTLIHQPTLSYITMWDSIKLNSKWECVHCGSFNPTTCTHCSVYEEFVHRHAPTLFDSTEHLTNILKYHENKKDNLYSWEDYEKDKL